MSKTTLPSNILSLECLYEILKFFDSNNVLDYDKLGLYVGIGKTYSINGVKTLEMLNAIKIENGYIIIAEYIKKDLKKINNKLEYKKVMKKIIFNWKPFIIFISFILQNYSIDEAAKKVYVISQLEGKDYYFLLKIIVNWGSEIDILTNEDDKLEIDESFVKTFNNKTKITIEDISVVDQVFIINLLGPEVTLFLTKEEIDLIVIGYSKIKDNPGDAIHSIGKFFEDFLRDIASFTAIDVTKCNGISEVASKLYNNNINGQIIPKIHSKQFDICKAIGTIRNMDGHNKEAKTNKSWVINEKTALLFFELVVSTTISIYQYVKNDIYLFGN